MTKSKMYKYKYTQCTSIYIKGLFFLEFELEGIDFGSHLCIQIAKIWSATAIVYVTRQRMLLSTKMEFLDYSLLSKIKRFWVS